MRWGVDLSWGISFCLPWKGTVFHKSRVGSADLHTTGFSLPLVAAARHSPVTSSRVPCSLPLWPLHTVFTQPEWRPFLPFPQHFISSASAFGRKLLLRLPGTATGVLPGHILVSPPPSGHSPFHSIMVTWQPFRKHFGAELGLVHRQLDP